MSMIDQLLYIKDFRERQAETAMQKSRLVLTEAHRAEDEAQQELDRFVQQAQEDERAWYQALCERVVKLRDIEDVQTDVAILRAEEAQRAKELDQAQQARVQAQSSFNLATQALREASTARSKFEELADRHHEALNKEAERKEDLELEELAGVVREREEMTTHADA
jgi:type III secretion protein O